MVVSTRTKPVRAPGIAQDEVDISQTRKLEQVIMELEDAVFDVLHATKGHAFHDVDFLYWNRRLKNIATPISMALAEYRGPRRFHEHYRHDPDNYDTLQPVAGPSPMMTLMRVCREALTDCADTTGLQDAENRNCRDQLEHALRQVLHRITAAIRG
jgi:hypothetical protein